MERTILRLGYVLALGGLAGPAFAVTQNTNPVAHFGDIQDRNVFGLKSPEVKTETSQPPKLPRLMLTGITTMLGNKQAFLKELPPVEGKMPDAVKEKFLMLTEGQRDGEIEVLQIDEKTGSVKVSNSGTLMTLTFEKDGPKPPVSAPPANQGIVPGGLPTGTRAGTAAAAPTPTFRSFLPPGYSNSNIHPLPTRMPRGAVTGSASTAQPGTTLSPTGSSLMPPAVYSNPNGTAAPEESQAVAEAQRQVLQQAASVPNLTAEDRQTLLDAQRQIMQYPTSNLPGGGSGTFTTPAQQGIAPAFAPPPSALPGRPIVPQ